MPSRLTAAAAYILSLVILTTTVVVPSVAQDAASKDGYRFQEASLQHIPDYDVLSLAYPPNLGLLIANGRDGYLTEMSHDSAPIQRLRLLLGLGEYTYDATSEGLHGYFSAPAGTLAPRLLVALQEAGFSDRAKVVAEAIAAFGPNYPVEDKIRSDFFAQSFLRIQEGIVPDLSKPPTAIDVRLRELGTMLANKTAFRAEVDAYAARDPVVAAALKHARETLPDEQRLSYLQDQLLPGPSGFGEAAEIKARIETMPPSYRTTYVLIILMGEVFNGGTHQFFYNSSGAFAEYVPQALREVGKNDAAVIIETAIAMFPKPYPVSTEERRRISFQHEWNTWDDKLDSFSNAIENDDISAALAAYAKKQGILPN
ncbi:DUF4375 domain-containing protein [Rhizobium sp. ZPR3]|uniref:DUF4375 domain-containing protein n=2 Tax=unclassified Rhizobium TaxID=2613769 RepID=A0AAU7SE82_9HYPH